MSRRIQIEGAEGWNGQRASTPAPAGTPPAGVPRALSPEVNLVDQAQADRIVKNQQDTRTRVEELVSRLARLDDHLSSLAGSQAAEVAEAVDDVRRQIATEREQRVEALQAQQAQERESLRDSLLSRVDRLAPGLATADWSAAKDGSPSMSRYIRVGRVGPGGLEIPAVVPLAGTPGWFIEAGRVERDDLLRNTLCRLVGQAPLKRIAVSVFDPRGRGVLGEFSVLRQASGTAFPPPIADARIFSQRLSGVLDRVTADSESAVASAFGDLVQQWRDAPVPEATLQIVVVLDYPYGLSDEAHELLQRAAAVDGPVRPCLLVAGDPNASGETTGVALRSLLTRMQGNADTWTVDTYLPDASIIPDSPCPEDVLGSVLASAASRAKADVGASIALVDLLADDLEHPWQHHSAESLDVVIGKIGRQDLQLSLRTSNPPYPNVLIGGAVGQGKSNLLLDIIYGLAVRYSPDELDFHLLDFKQGVEFARFGPDDEGSHWLPHVRTLGLESDLAFGLAVLQAVDGELNDRAEKFKRARVSSIGEFRDKTGEKMSRVVLVIDEFHVLFSGDDAHVEAALEVFERLARLGRSHGIHLLLASQTPSGVAALAVKGDSIFAQFPIRISLKNTAAESEAVLSPGNKAAADLTYRGEVVFNTNLGLAGDGANQIGMIAHAEPHAMAELQRRLWQRGHGSAPLVFYGTEYAAWPTQPPIATPEGVTVWLGRPVVVSDAPRVHVLGEDADQAVAVIGDMVASRNAVHTMALSGMSSLTGGEIVVLNGDGDDAEKHIAAWRAAARGAGVGFTCLDRRSAAAWIREGLSQRLDEEAAGPMLILGLSLQRLRDMDVQTASEESDDFNFDLAQAVTAREVLARTAHDGAKNGTFLIAGWTNTRTMEADLGFSPGVGLTVTADAGLEELRAVAGHAARPITQKPRLGIYDRRGHDGLEVVVPYDPEVEPGWIR